MVKTLRISFALKNTYRVNGILHALKQIPLLGRLLPDALYQVRGLKCFANVLAILWEIVSIFLGKFLYFCTMVCGVGLLYRETPAAPTFLHVLFFLTCIGSYMNTSIFDASRDKYYAIILLRMDARAYTLANYGYALAKSVVGFLPFTVLFGMDRAVPLWLCLVLPLCIAGIKLAVAAYSLWDYEKNGRIRNENHLQKYAWGLTGLLLLLAYVPPALGFALPFRWSAALFLIWIPAGLLSAGKVLTFRHYRAFNQAMLADLFSQIDAAKSAAKTVSEKAISADPAITSRKQGFEYLNELFVKRHRKILWRSAKRTAWICAFLCCGVLLAMGLAPEIRPAVNEMVLTWLPYFVFILYLINRGTSFTNALFLNCDHSLLTYSFYKRPDFVLKLFQIRLREIIKINAVPALVLGVGMVLILLASGGTDTPLNYGVLVVSILAMSVFFSIHYLTIYYLLQPYTAGTELKSGTYRLVTMVTYAVCYAMTRIRLPLFGFGIACIAFCMVYSLLASILVYRLAPRTFRIRP